MIRIAAAAAIFPLFIIDAAHFLVGKKNVPRSLFLGLLFGAMIGAFNFTQSSHDSLPLLLFIFALCISIATDYSYFLISRYATLYLIPLIWMGAYFHKIPLTLYESIEGTFLSFAFLWSIKHIFLLIKKYEGLGQGDIDMLAFIGAFTGILGAWCSLIYACIVCLIYIPANYLITRTYNPQIPLGVFLGIGCWLHLLFPHAYLNILNA